MFAPARLWTSRAPVRSRIFATIAAVVVLPLVALITTLPRSSRLARRPIACGSTRVSTLPGSDVPAAAPGGARERADRLGGGHTSGKPDHAGATTRNEPGSTRTVSGRSPIGSPSAYAVNGRSAWNFTSLACTSLTAGSWRWVPLNTRGSPRR